MSEQPYGVRQLVKEYEEWAGDGMLANIGSKIVEVGVGKLVIEASMNERMHGFPTSRGPIVHGGAIATLADEALASVAFTLAEEGEVTPTSGLQLDYYRPAKLGRLRARPDLRHPTPRLANRPPPVFHPTDTLLPPDP